MKLSCSTPNIQPIQHLDKTLSGEHIPFNQAYDTAPWLQMVIMFPMGPTLVMASLPKVQLPIQKRT